MNEVFAKYEVPAEFDLLTIDIDFNDYWVWRALLRFNKYRPRVVALDYNADLNLEDTKAVAYNAEAEWDGTRYTTASLHSYYLLAQEHGYEYAYNLEMGSHVFFVRRDLLHEEDWGLPIRAVKKLSHKTDVMFRPFVETLFSHSKETLKKRLAENQLEPDEAEKNKEDRKKVVSDAFTLMMRGL